VDGAPNPLRNGLTVVRQLRQQGLPTAVILFTGWPDLVDRSEARKLGVIEVMEKPLGIQELRKALAGARKAVQSAAAQG
jgi:FixJ family two-component response regulator